MWRLIAVLLFIIVPLGGNKETILIVVDDCQNWRKINTRNSSETFSLSKDVSIEQRVSLIHGWLDPTDSLSKMSINHPIIKDAKICYASLLKEEDWYKLSSDLGPRIFILRPADFCSNKRFVLNYDFSVFEVILNVSRKE